MNFRIILLATITLLLAISTQKPAIGQSNGSLNEKINITQEYNWKLMYVDSALTNISNAVIVNAGISLQIGSPWNTISKNYYFLVNGHDAFAFYTLDELFQSSEFLSTIHPDFRLQTSTDVMKFLSFLYMVDQNYFHKGYFTDNQNWYFVRREFFDDLRGWKVATDAQGKIISMEYSDELAVARPDELMEAGNQIQYYEQPPIPEISEKAHQNMEDYAARKMKYSLEERPIEPLIYQKVTAAAFSELSVILTEEVDGNTFNDITRMWLIEYEQGSEVYNYIDDALVSDQFQQSLHPWFSIQTREDALAFEAFLDAVTDFDSREKQIIQKENNWLFIRSQPFDNGRGFIVSTDKNGTIQSIRYDDRIDSEAIPEKPFDESTADWGFQLVEPQTNKVVLTEGATVYIQIGFNETPVNRMGAWILTRVNGKNQGMVAGTEMYSPFTDEINGSYLGTGTHTIEYMLLRSGMDTENPLATVTMEVDVKTFNPEGIDWEFMLLEPDQTDFVAKPGVSIPVQMSYNEQAVQENGVYMLISYKGEIVGGEKPQNMHSPFNASIPGAVLTQGMHQITFLLMPPGSENPEMALDKIIFNIEVK